MTNFLLFLIALSVIRQECRTQGDKHPTLMAWAYIVGAGIVFAIVKKYF